MTASAHVAEQSRERRALPMEPRELRAQLLVAALFVLAAGLLLAFGLEGEVPVTDLVLLVAAAVILGRLDFETTARPLYVGRRWVHDEEHGMEAPIISGVTHDVSEAKVTIFRVPDRPGIAAKVFRALADENVNVDMIEQNVSTDDHTDISFTIPRDELTRTMEIVDKMVVEIDAGGANFDDAIGRVSVVGAGMKTNPGVAAQMFETLATEQVNIEMISTSTIRISCVVHEDDVERAVRALHTAFELEATAP